MQPSEKLMVFLEINGVDISNYIIRRQIEIIDSSQKGTYKIDTVQKLLELKYEKETNHQLRFNPLAYLNNKNNVLNNLEEITVYHPDLDTSMTLSELLKLNKFSPIQKESILYDIFDEFVRDYRDITNKRVDNYERMILLLPRKQKRYKKPSSIKFFISIFSTIYLLLIFHKPSSAFILGPDMHELMIKKSWYNILIFITTLLFVLYAISNNIINRFIKDMKNEKNKTLETYFKKWRAKLDKKRLKQSGILEDYVDDVVNQKRETPLPLSYFSGPEKLLLKYRRYVLSLHNKNDFFQKYHPLFRKILDLIFIFAIILLTVCILIIIGINGGWFNG